MMRGMKRRLLTIFLAVMTLALPLRPAFGGADEEEQRPNVRLSGYPRSVESEKSGTALTYILLILIAGVCVAVMFKDAKRSHLD